MPALNPVAQPADHHQGNIRASITLIEYGDFQCEHCKHALSLIKRLLKEKGNDILFIFRNFPLVDIHPQAFNAAVAAEAAGRQYKYWKMHNLLFAHQDKLDTNYFLTLAERLGLDTEQFVADLKDRQIQDKINRDFQQGIHGGVHATPTFFINGARVLTYDGTYDSLLEAINDEIWRYRRFLDEIKE